MKIWYMYNMSLSFPIIKCTYLFIREREIHLYFVCHHLPITVDSCFVFSRSGIWTWWGIALWLCVLSRCQRDPSLMATTSSDTSCSARIKRHRSKNRERFGFDCSTLPTWPKYNHRPLECFLVLLWLVESCMWALITMRLLFNITSSLHSK